MLSSHLLSAVGDERVSGAGVDRVFRRHEKREDRQVDPLPPIERLDLCGDVRPGNAGRRYDVDRGSVT